MRPDLSTYGGLERDIGYPGQVADGNPKVTISKVVIQNPAATEDLAIPFGSVVSLAPTAFTDGVQSDAHCTVDATATTPLGILLRHAIFPANDKGGVDAKAGQSVGIMKQGFVFVVAKFDVTAGAPATFDPATGEVGIGGTALGTSTWQTTTSAGKVGVVYVNV